VFVAPDRLNRFTLAGGASPLGFFGLGRRSVNLGASGAKATVTFTGTSFSLLYTGGPATNNIQVTIDGGNAQVINTNTPAGITSGLRWDSGPLTAGSHTVEFAWNSGGGAVINGIMVFNGDENAGIRVWESGHAGDNAGLLVQPSTGGKWIGDVATVKPDVIVLEFGINDWRTSGGYDAPTFQTNMTTLIAALRVQAPLAPIVLFIPPMASGGVPHGSWSAYRDVYYALAAADATLVLCDVGSRIGPTTGNTFPLFTADNLHPNDQGYSMIADILLDLLG
jgi:lysophospholipase L1-like esterase